MITGLSGLRTAAPRGNTRILSSSTDNSLRLWKIEAATQMVFRGRRADQSLECCALITPQSFVAGDVHGSLSLFSASKKKAVFAVHVRTRWGFHGRTRTESNRCVQSAARKRRGGGS